MEKMERLVASRPTNNKKVWRLSLVGATALLLFGIIYIKWNVTYISDAAIQQAVFHSLSKEEQEALGDRAWRYFKVEKMNLKDIPTISSMNFSQKTH